MELWKLAPKIKLYATIQTQSVTGSTQIAITITNHQNVPENAVLTAGSTARWWKSRMPRVWPSPPTFRRRRSSFAPAPAAEVVQAESPTEALPPEQAPPTDAPAPVADASTSGNFDTGAQYQIVHYRVLGFADNNGGIFNKGGQQFIFVTVLDQNVNGVEGAVVKKADNLNVAVGNKGPGKAEIKMDWDPYKLYVAADGLVTNQSEFSVEEPVERLQSILEEKGLTVFLVVDHAANAANAGLELRPTVLVLTGNPNLGTPLMQSNPTIGLDLPQKFLVWEDAAGDVFITYNAPEYLAQRHNIGDQDEVFGKITGALNAFATTSASSK